MPRSMVQYRIIQYRGHFSSKIVTKTLHSSPVRARYGVSPLWILSPIYILHFSSSRYMLYHVISERVMKMSWRCPTDLSHKSHNAPVPYLRMHRFVTEMCTCVHISVTKCAFWDICLMHWGICEMMGLLCVGDTFGLSTLMSITNKSSAIHSQTPERVL